MSDDSRPRPGPPDTRFLILVGTLLLAIIAILAGLWLRAHRRALRAEGQVASLQPLADAHALGQRYVQELPKYLSVPREALATRSVTLDGRTAQALRLPAAVGRLIGFEPGDVILVEPTATTAGAADSRPAARPGQ